ncbi:sigma factor SigX-regulated lipoprotein [Leptospira adleri]|uniref:Lipoprotein n=1 Tax=Leptospira adleri TaxID=2023186 RepID=A0A2M9YPB5_9LEPT|nr:hypothetical protein [Leptospira adleri]PJZ53330.1 hypothetical protein CH380_11040 [Leptospira adleri]PJZ63862.1 hypothetical protein CH376_00070 [Leptospira adleri]
MLIKKISVVLALALFFAQCNGKGDHSSNDQNLLLLAAAVAPKNPGASGLYASINALRTAGGGGGAGNYSNGNASPFAQLSGTLPCPRGGTLTLNGDVSGQMNGSEYTYQYNGVKVSYVGCALLVPQIDNSNQTASALTIDGDITEDVNQTQSLDPSNTSTNYAIRMSGTTRMRSSNYKVNGFTFPTFDVTFTNTNSKYSFENMTDIDNAYIQVEETVHMSGTIGTETVNQDFSYKAKYRFK